MVVFVLVGDLLCDVVFVFVECGDCWVVGVNVV